jgi:uncharacterized protein
MLPVAIAQRDLVDFCQRHHIRKLALFGSVLREDFRPDSDIDVLVEFEPGRSVSLFDLGGAQQELSELLGREADLKTSGFLSPYFRQQVIDSAQVIYESQ